MPGTEMNFALLRLGPGACGVVVRLLGCGACFAAGAANSAAALTTADRLMSAPCPRVETTWHPVLGEEADRESAESSFRHDPAMNGLRWVDLEFAEKKGDAQRSAPESVAATDERQAGIRRTKPIALLSPRRPSRTDSPRIPDRTSDITREWEEGAMPLLSAVMMLLLVLDPLGNIPLFVATLQRVELRKRTRVLIRELLIALGVLLLFLLAGHFILDVLQVRQPSLTIAGGVILFLISVQMIFPISQSMFGQNPEGDPFIVPLAIPLVAGPSALTTVLLFTSLEPAHATKWLVAVVCAWLIASAILLLSGKLSELLGSRGLIALERLMGMLLLTVAVQMFLTGIALLQAH
jgi:MarC family membrane protein